MANPTSRRATRPPRPGGGRRTSAPPRRRTTRERWPRRAARPGPVRLPSRHGHHRSATATHRSATATSRPATATERSATATERSAGNPGRSTGRSTLGKGTRGNQPQRRRRRQSGPECRCESVKEIQRLRLGFHRRPTGASRSSRLCCPPDQPGSGRRTRSCRQHVGSVPVSPQHQPGGHREQQRHHQCGHDDPPMASIDLASPVVPRRAESRGHPGPQGEPSRSVERASNTSGRPSGPRTTTPIVST